MDVRVLCPRDYDAIINVWKGAGLPCRPKGRDSREEMVRQMAIDRDMFLGCFVDRELVGVIIGSYDSRKGWINRLAVVPERRRKGIARTLIRKMEDVLKEKGVQIIATLIEDDSPESMKLFSGEEYLRHDDIHYYTKRENKDI